MKTDILRFLSDEILSGQGAELQSSDDLLSTEIIDSMGVMRLIAFIEGSRGVKIPPEDVTVENFLSVDTICQYLEQREVTRSQQP